MSNAETVLAAFHDAQADGAAVDWQALAAALAAAIPAPKRRKASADAVPDWWVSYALPKAFHMDSLAVTFADGQTVRSNATRAPGKPWRIEAAVRGAVAYWRAKMRTDGAAPEILAIALADGSESWDAATVSRLSAGIRAPLPPVRPAPRPRTLEGLERLETEHVRRKAGLARAQATERAYGHDVPKGHVYSTYWLAAVKAIRAEILAYREALPRPRPAPAAMLLIAGPVAPVAQDADAIAETLAEAYAAPAWAEIGGTVDAPEPGQGADRAPAPAPDRTGPAAEPIADPVAPAAVFILAPSIEAEKMNMPPAEEIATPTPAEEIGEAWGPTDASHPIVALCLSEPARVALHAAVMDGTAPAHGRAAKGGAWRLSLADAQALQHIKSIRWVGMPRKAYTRRPAPPAEAIRVHTPREAIVTPHAAFIPGAGRLPQPVTFHAAP